MVVEGAEVVELFLVVDFSTICGVVETVDLAVLKLVPELGAAVVEDGAAVVEVGAAVVEVGAAVVELGVVGIGGDLLRDGDADVPLLGLPLEDVDAGLA